MRGMLLKIPAVARGAGYVAVAVALAAAALHFRQDRAAPLARPPTPAVESDSLAPELARCQAIGMAAKDDAACEAAWAENRRRFFNDHSATSTPNTQQPAPKPEGR